MFIGRNDCCFGFNDIIEYIYVCPSDPAVNCGNGHSNELLRYDRAYTFQMCVFFF